MTTHQCPFCPLIFDQKTVLAYHIREDHPHTEAEYPIERPADADWPMATTPTRTSYKRVYPVRRRP